MEYNGAFEAWKVHRVNNLWIKQASLAIPIQPTIFSFAGNIVLAKQITVALKGKNATM